MRSTNYLLTLALLFGCGGGQSTDSTTPVMTEPPVEEPVAGDSEQPTEPEKPAEPVQPPAPTPGDPAEVGPDVYKVITENEQVRAFEVTFAPGAKMGLHKHPDHIAFALTAGKLTLMGQDGAAQEIELKAGDGMFLEAQAHSAENKTDKEIKALVVELRAGSKSPAPKGKDPLKAGGKMYRKVFENEKVRLLEVTFKKGSKIAAHAHPDHFNYVAEGGQLEVTGPGAEGTVSKQKLDLTAGQGVFLPAQVHSARNSGKTQIRIVVLELKPDAAAPAPVPVPAK